MIITLIKLVIWNTLDKEVIWLKFLKLVTVETKLFLDVWIEGRAREHKLYSMSK